MITSFLILPLVITFVIPSTSFADRREEQEKLNRIRQEKKEQKETVKEAEAKLKKSKAELEKVEKQIADYDQKMNQLNRNLSKNQQDLDKKKEQVSKVVRRLYIQGDTRYMAEILSARSFSEFILRFETLRTLVKRETRLLSNYQDIKRNIEKSIKNLEAAKKKQQPLLKEFEKRLSEVEDLYKKANKELAELEKQEEATLKDIQELDRLARQASEQYGGVNLGTGILGFPTTRGSVSWNFGQNRGTHIHAGIDIARPIGTPIFAADSGVVSLTKSNPGGYGYYVIINHGNGLSTLYAHMYPYTVTVGVGDRVRKGQVIAKVGNNGRSSGPHLHFEVRKNGTPVNPKNYLN